MKRNIAVRALVLVVFIAFIGTAIFLLVRMVLSYSFAATAGVDPGGQAHSWGEYLPMFLECLIGIFAMLLPGILEKRAHLTISSIMLILYAAFLFCAIYLGEVRAFYYRIPYWDVILHSVSSIAIACVGFSLVELLNNSKKVIVNLSPAFVAIFAFCFALAIGALWEICEFTVDNIFATNAQKYATEAGVALVGQAALADTMKDLIVDALGALLVSTFGYLLLRWNKTLPSWLLIGSSDEEPETVGK